MQHRAWYRAAIVILLLLVCIGCGSIATQKQFYEPLTAELRAGKYQSVIAQIESARQDGKYGKKDRFIYYVDAGMAYHYAREYDSSNLRLADAERTSEELYTKSISKAFLANTFLNDNVLEYPGEDYEVLYTNLVMALNYVALNKFDDAFVEIRRANDKLDLLEQKYVDLADRFSEQSRKDTSQVYIPYTAPQIRFNNSAFARYLSMHMYAADGKYDDAEIDYRHFLDAYQSQPNIYPFEPPLVKYHDKTDAILSVVGFAGLEPVKEALNLRLRSDKKLDVLTVIYTDANVENTFFNNFPLPDGIGDIYAKLSIPQLVPLPSKVHSMRVYAGARLLGNVQIMEDISTIARETFSARQSMILWRTVMRTLAKTLASSKLKKKIDDGGIGGWLGKLAVDVVHDISENADLRSTHLLPGRIYAGDFVIDPGTYDIKVEFLDTDGMVIESRFYPQVTVRKNDFNLLHTFCLQ